MLILHRFRNTSWIICGARANHVRSYALSHAEYQLFLVCFTHSIMDPDCYSLCIFGLLVSYALLCFYPVAERISAERGEAVGDTVGYKVLTKCYIFLCNVLMHCLFLAPLYGCYAYQKMNECASKCFQPSRVMCPRNH